MKTFFSLDGIFLTFTQKRQNFHFFSKVKSHFLVRTLPRSKSISVLTPVCNLAIYKTNYCKLTALSSVLCKSSKDKENAKPLDKPEQ